MCKHVNGNVSRDEFGEKRFHEDLEEGDEVECEGSDIGDHKVANKEEGDVGADDVIPFIIHIEEKFEDSVDWVNSFLSSEDVIDTGH